MALQPINIGTTGNDGTGDAARTAFQKVNANEAYLLSLINQAGGNSTYSVLKVGSKGASLPATVTNGEIALETGSGTVNKLKFPEDFKAKLDAFAALANDFNFFVQLADISDRVTAVARISDFTLDGQQYVVTINNIIADTFTDVGNDVSITVDIQLQEANKLEIQADIEVVQTADITSLTSSSKIGIRRNASNQLTELVLGSAITTKLVLSGIATRHGLGCVLKNLNVDRYYNTLLQYKRGGAPGSNIGAVYAVTDEPISISASVNNTMLLLFNTAQQPPQRYLPVLSAVDWANPIPSTNIGDRFLVLESSGTKHSSWPDVFSSGKNNIFEVVGAPGGSPAYFIIRQSLNQEGQRVYCVADKIDYVFKDSVWRKDVGTTTYATLTGAVNVDVSALADDVYYLLTGNTTITWTNTPALGQSFIRSFIIKSTTAETLNLPAADIIEGSFNNNGSENRLIVSFSNYATEGLKIVYKWMPVSASGGGKQKQYIHIQNEWRDTAYPNWTTFNAGTLYFFPTANAVNDDGTGTPLVNQSQSGILIPKGYKVNKIVWNHSTTLSGEFEMLFLLGKPSDITGDGYEVFSNGDFQGLSNANYSTKMNLFELYRDLFYNNSVNIFTASNSVQYKREIIFDTTGGINEAVDNDAQLIILLRRIQSPELAFRVRFIAHIEIEEI